jgi:hypothetical protein
MGDIERVAPSAHALFQKEAPRVLRERDRRERDRRSRDHHPLQPQPEDSLELHEFDGAGDASVVPPGDCQESGESGLDLKV